MKEVGKIRESGDMDYLIGLRKASWLRSGRRGQGLKVTCGSEATTFGLVLMGLPPEKHSLKKIHRQLWGVCVVNKSRIVITSQNSLLQTF